MTGGSEVVLGLDLGTTATKVVAVDRRLQVIDTIERAYPMRSGRTGEAVHDPLAVLDAVVDAVRESVASRAADRQAVRGLSFSAALHTLLGLDAAGAPATDALSWADTRSLEIAGRIRREQGSELHHATGTPVHPMAPMTKLAWFATERPELSVAHWCGLKDFVLARLTGRLVTDLSCASGTGLLDIRRMSWHGPALDVARVSERQLPELLEPTAVLPLAAEAAEMVGLPSGLPVVAGAGDGPLANLGVGAIAPGAAALSVGTSGALRVTRHDPAVDERCRVFCYYLADGLWVTGGAVSNAGVVAQWAAESLAGIPIARLLDEAAEVEAGAGGLIALPYLLGERAPWWDAEVPGALIGLRREHGRATIARALIEGAGQQLALVRDSILEAGARVETVRATGGAFRSRVWADVLAAALDMPLHITHESAGSGLGAAILGWRALGELPALDSAVGPDGSAVTGGAWTGRPGRTVEPDTVAARRMRETRHLVERAYDLLKQLPSGIGEK